MRSRGTATRTYPSSTISRSPRAARPVLQRLQSLLQQVQRDLDARRLSRATADCDSAVFSIWPIPVTGQAGTAGRPRLRHRPRSRWHHLEHQGCGLARTQFLSKQYGERTQLFREIKDAFDPLDQLNPGKVIGDDPHLVVRSLKSWHAEPDRPEPERGGPHSSPGAAARLPPRPSRRPTLRAGRKQPIPWPSTPSRPSRRSSSPPCMA